MLNEAHRTYVVQINDTNGGHRILHHRTREEAKSAVMHWLPSWTTKAVTVVNTANWHGKNWTKGKKGEVKTTTYPREDKN